MQSDQAKREPYVTRRQRMDYNKNEYYKSKKGSGIQTVNHTAKIPDKSDRYGYDSFTGQTILSILYFAAGINYLEEHTEN